MSQSQSIVTQIKCSHRSKNFNYLITCPETKETAVVDPSFCADSLSEKLKEQELSLKYIINTHCHYDHSRGNVALQTYFPEAKVITHSSAQSVKSQITVEDGQILTIGSIDIEIIHTPGHTDEDICLYVNEQELITGDVLFAGKVGGTRDRETARIQFDSLNRLMNLPDDTIIYPGHDNGDYPTSTIRKEKENNPFLLRLNNFDDFYWLKENWKDFKQQHGIS